ncbi:MAG: NAD(P)/FAD-dependent oxidoreductase, partial [Anaerolineales bacterium]|nr:NAD(P)/FAD-dependent oxidoreductase [Anaerolineales bacterium]
ADVTGLVAAAPGIGLPAGGSAALTAVPETLLLHLQQVKTRWNAQQQAQLEALGIIILQATAVFADPHTVTITPESGDPHTRKPDAIIVASGSVPVFPPTMRPNGRQIIAPRFASALGRLPASIAVIGGGATGTEFAYLFNRLGVAVTWIVDQFGVLPQFDRQAADLLAALLVRRGVRLVQGQMATRVDTAADGVTIVLADGACHSAEMAFLALGRRPDLERLNLAAAGLALVDGLLPVDAYGRSVKPHVYVVGDATGGPMIANRAMAQARTAGLHAADVPAPVCPLETVIHAIYSDPQVAQVGTLTGPGVRVASVPYAAGLKAHLAPEAEGFVKLAADAAGRLVGGTAVGTHAADLLAPVAVAIHTGMAAADFAALYAAHPTVSELAFAAARALD